MGLPSENAVARDKESPLVYFIYTGWIIGIMLLVTMILRLTMGDYGWMFLRQLLAVAVTTLVFVTYEVLDLAGFLRFQKWMDRLNAAFGGRVTDPIIEEVSAEISPMRKALGRLGLVVYLATAASLVFLDHRVFIVAIGLLEVVAVCALRPTMSRRYQIWLATLAASTWVLASGLTYTHLTDWLMNGSPSTGLAGVAFVVAFGAVVIEMCDESIAKPSLQKSLTVLGIGLLAFTAFAFRTDHLLAEWTPIHRSYFADVSQSVRNGHILLWDVPSLYGFFSILSLALIPAKNGWQAVYELTGVFLTFEALVTFAILRWGRSGLANYAVAILLPLGAIFGDSIARYPWSARLYPQGGLRLVWVVALLFVVFLAYIWRASDSRVRVLRVIGHAIWMFSILWSMEAGLWATAIWVPYLLIGSVTNERDRFQPFAMLKRCIGDCWPLVVLPILAIGVIEVFYRVRFGIVPDWRAYLEFTGLFTSGKVRSIFWVQPYGAGWTILLVLGALGTLGLVALRERKLPLARLLAGAWLAVWATASYFALEPLDFYVDLLMGVLAPALAIVMFASRELRGNGVAFVTRLSVAPIAIIAIALLLGEPSRLAAMAFPFTPGWNFDVTQQMPPISGELGQLMKSAGVEPSDPVLIPNGDFWTEIDQGLVLPFTRLEGGTIVQYQSWLPTSPVGPEMLFEGLSSQRQHTYVDRYLNVSRRAGWYITYRKQAKCQDLSKRLETLRSYSSTNFSISRCQLAR